MMSDMTFSGLGSTFGGEPDSYGDVVARGAFTESLKRRRPALLLHHDSRQPVGVYTDVVESSRGLEVAGRLLDTTAARDAYTLLKGGAFSGLSIGFVTRLSHVDSQTGIRHLLEVDLFEVSLVVFPANDRARVLDVRADETPLLKPALRRFEDGLRTKSDAEHYEDIVDAVRRMQANCIGAKEESCMERAFVDPAELQRRKCDLERRGNVTAHERRRLDRVEDLIDTQRRHPERCESRA